MAMQIDDPVTAFRETHTGARPKLPNGFWGAADSDRAILEAIWTEQGITAQTSPATCRRRWFDAYRLGALLRAYRRSPYVLLTTLYPGRYTPADFPEFPKADDLQAEAFGRAGIPVEEPLWRRRAMSIQVRARRRRDEPQVPQ
jgi:hypothetical protein